MPLTDPHAPQSTSPLRPMPASSALPHQTQAPSVAIPAHTHTPLSRPPLSDLRPFTWTCLRPGALPQTPSPSESRPSQNSSSSGSLPSQTTSLLSTHNNILVNDKPHIQQQLHNLIAYFYCTISMLKYIWICKYYPLCYTCPWYSVQDHAVQVCSLGPIFLFFF